MNASENVDTSCSPKSSATAREIVDRSASASTNELRNEVRLSLNSTYSMTLPLAGGRTANYRWCEDLLCWELIR